MTTTPKRTGGLMDPNFKYVPARNTDIRETFKRVRQTPPIPLKTKEPK